MPYITIKQSPSYHQITFEEMMAGVEDLGKYVFDNTSNTRTYFAERVMNTAVKIVQSERRVSAVTAECECSQSGG